MEPTLHRLLDEDALRIHLDVLNDSGVDPTASGMDAHGTPFIAMLRGPYAEGDVVLFNTPWDSETETTRGYRCTECTAQEPARFKDLAFPIVVLVVRKKLNVDMATGWASSEDWS